MSKRATFITLMEEYERSYHAFEDLDILLGANSREEPIYSFMNQIETIAALFFPKAENYRDIFAECLYDLLSPQGYYEYYVTEDGERTTYVVKSWSEFYDDWSDEDSEWEAIEEECLTSPLRK